LKAIGTKGRVESCALDWELTARESTVAAGRGRPVAV
jgi:hypothetical protein